MITPVDAENLKNFFCFYLIQKAFDKNTSPIHNKTQKTRNRGKLLQFEKVIYKKPTANIEVKNSEIGNKARMFAFTTAVQHNTSFSQCNKERKKGIQIRNE